MEPGATVSAVRSQRVLCGNEIVPAVILIKDGKIQNILPGREVGPNASAEVRCMAETSSVCAPLMPPSGWRRHFVMVVIRWFRTSLLLFSQYTNMVKTGQVSRHELTYI